MFNPGIFQANRAFAYLQRVCQKSRDVWQRSRPKGSSLLLRRSGATTQEDNHDELSDSRAGAGRGGDADAGGGCRPGRWQHHRQRGGSIRHADRRRAAAGQLRHPDRRREAGLQRQPGILPFSRPAARHLRGSGPRSEVEDGGPEGYPGRGERARRGGGDHGGRERHRGGEGGRVRSHRQHHHRQRAARCSTPTSSTSSPSTSAPATAASSATTSPGASNGGGLDARACAAATPTRTPSWSRASS